MKNNEVLILLDADVVIHLFKADKISLLQNLYPGRLRMLDVVLEELKNNRTINSIVENLFTFKQVVELKFPTTSSPEMFKEYVKLKTSIKGDGERACLLYCKYNNHIIASSNTTDIVPFCNEHNIAYLTTLDILCVAVHRGLLNEGEANDCIQKIVTQGSRLSHHLLEQYRNKKFDSQKLNY